MLIGHIGARGGSKGVPGKNLITFGGVPLIEWSIKRLQQSGLVEDIYVNTDDELIASIGLNYGCRVIDREKQLGSDTASKFDVWKSSVLQIRKERGVEHLDIIDLDCTSPLRSVDDVCGAYEKYKTFGEPVLLMSVCQPRKNPYFNMVEINGGKLQIVKSHPNLASPCRRQDAPIVYDHAASIYIFSSDILNHQTLFENTVIPYEMEWWKCWDIDEVLDLSICDFFRVKFGVNF